MKKFIIFVMAGLMMVSVAGCGTNNKDTSSNNQTSSQTTSQVDNANTADGTPLDVLNTVWNVYKDDEKFPVAGGDFSEENNNMEGPGKYALDDPTAIESSFGLPEASVSKVEDCASLIHMMNANTFTCSAFRVKAGEDVTTVATEIHNTLANRQWVCGAPDKMVIFINGSDVITVFGEKEIVDDFTTKIKTVFPDVQVNVEEDILIE